MKKLTALLLTVVMLLIAVCGCAQTAPTEGANTEAPATTENAAEPAAEGAKKDVKDMKVALIFLGAISDLGWDYTAYCGL